MQAIANDLGLSVQHVSEVIAGRRRSARVEEAVARAIGKRVEDVFPPVEQPAAA